MLGMCNLKMYAFRLTLHVLAMLETHPKILRNNEIVTLKSHKLFPKKFMRYFREQILY